MWLKRNKEQETELPDKLRYARYYEHDGALRAYANRAMLLAFLCVPATLLSLGFAVLARRSGISQSIASFRFPSG
jgi:hypothetical protein